MSTAAPALASGIGLSEAVFWRRLGMVGALAAVVRLAWSLGVVRAAPMCGDAADYYSQAVSLLPQLERQQAFYWPPGTAYLLAAVFCFSGPSELIARVIIAVIAGLQAALTGCLARDLTRSHLAGLMAAGLWAVYPPAVLYADQSGSQHLAAFCLAGVLLFATRAVRRPNWRDTTLCGLLLGLGCLTRPSMLSVAFLLPFALAVRAPWAHRSELSRQPGCGHRLTHQHVFVLLGTLAVLAVVVLPTAQHNARAGGGWTLSINNERNFFIGNNPHTPWYKTSHLAQRSLDEHPAEVRVYLQSVYTRPNPRQAMTQAALEHIRQRPDLFLLRTLSRARAFWGVDYLASRTLQQTLSLNSAAFLAALGVEAGGYLLVILLALYGLTLWRQLDPLLRLSLVAGTAAYAVPYLLAFSAGTYHYPVIPLLIPFAAGALVKHERLELPWRALRSRAWLWMACGFLLLQVEYLYFALRFAA